MLTVIVPTYNRPKMLVECLTSILASTADLQVIIADDHSEQDTMTAFEPFVGDGRVGYIWQRENLGVLGNVNEVLRVTTGDYICVVPDDDTVNPGNFEQKVAILDEHPEIGFVYSQANVMDGSGHVMGVASRPEFLSQSYIGGRDEFRDLLSGNWIYGASVVFRRSLYDQLGYQDPALPATLADWDVWLRYAKAAPTAYIAEPLVNTRLHDDTLNNREIAGMPFGMVAVWRKWLPEVEAPPWPRMRAMYGSEVTRCIDDPQQRYQALSAWVALVAEHHRREAA